VSAGISYRFFEKFKGQSYSGVVRYSTASGAPRKQTFLVSVEAHRASLVHDEEAALTQRELQKIPAGLEAIVGEIGKLRKAVQDFQEREKGENERSNESL
jgi:hypothetical protein